ncbi:hypothetical protein [Magnetospirillum sp. ME-1]|uniref:hypothetical protein n=1 Tax=Magnetospirillum sp. ME-1 TaxID=1639348 RepID=UPI0011AE33A8|nr:hypothetical protein [Magnetospirillum sp. ME-1]
MAKGRYRLYSLDPVEEIASGTKREMLNMMRTKASGSFTVSTEEPKPVPVVDEWEEEGNG